jgi:hypothetical protein
MSFGIGRTSKPRYMDWSGHSSGDQSWGCDPGLALASAPLGPPDGIRTRVSGLEGRRPDQTRPPGAEGIGPSFSANPLKDGRFPISGLYHI